MIDLSKVDFEMLANDGFESVESDGVTYVVGPSVEFLCGFKSVKVGFLVLPEDDPDGKIGVLVEFSIRSVGGPVGGFGSTDWPSNPIRRMFPDWPFPPPSLDALVHDAARRWFLSHLWD